jgi:drug/metabolite transporter (DMT)-like permease
VGFAGMILLVGPSSLSGHAGVSLAGAGIVMAGSLAWAFGSIYSRNAELPRNPLMATAAEMFSAGVLLTIGTLVRGELATLRWEAISGTSVLALAYLIVFGSLVAFSAYVWLLGNTTPALVSTYAYVNPLVAVFLGWMVLSEPITTRVLVAAAVIISAVAIITTGPKPGAGKARDVAPRPTGASDGEPATEATEAATVGKPRAKDDGRSAA